MTQADGGASARQVPVTRFKGAASDVGARTIPSELAVALVHDGSTTAVMMATPADLEDLAVGFSLSEGIVSAVGEIASCEVVLGSLGAEARVWLVQDRATELAARRRRIIGPTGCGLCGVESLAEAVRPPPRVAEGVRLTPGQIYQALAELPPMQTLGRATHAAHGAALWSLKTGLQCVREDVGRHNAVDKLIGALARAGQSGDRDVLVVTSRLSVEMVQKAAVLGVQVIAGMSAPTALAVETAEACGLTLVGVARPDGFEVFTRPDRIAS